VVFLGFNIIAKTAIQKSPDIGINTRTVLQPNIYYTCPAGKVAKVKGRVTCTGTGAAAQGRFLIDGTITYRWENQVNPAINMPLVNDTDLFYSANQGLRKTLINTYMTFEFTLNAGEDFSTDQDSGTNAEFNVFAEITESPA